MIRFILCVIVVVGFLILSIPILFVEWIIGKFNPMAKEISSLRIVQAVFRFILWISGVKLTVIGEENVPTDVPVLYITEAFLMYRSLIHAAPSVPAISQKKRWKRFLCFLPG